LNSIVHFVDLELKKSFEKLKESKTESKQLYQWLNRAFKDLQENPFCGVQIQKRLIPKKYVKKYNLDNLWKYNLPGAWRLIYSVQKNNIFIISIVVEWMKHKDYERCFGYN